MELANRRQFCNFVSRNCRAFFACLIYRNLGQRKSRCLPHDFEGCPLKKQNIEVKKGISLCCPDFYSFWWCYISYYFVPTRMKAAKTLWVQNYQTQEEIKHSLAVTLSQFLSSQRKIPGSLDSVSTVVVFCEWNPQYVRYTTLNFSFINLISFLLNISFVLFDTSYWNICRWDYMLSNAVFTHNHINLGYKTPFIIRDLRSRTITAAAQAKDAVRVRSNTVGTTYFLLQN